MNVRTYASPQAFKHALADRLRTVSRDGFDLARRRQLLVFDRFLARVVALFGDAVARLHELPWSTLDAVTAAARAFLDPVLARRPVTTWSPGPGLWS